MRPSNDEEAVLENASQKLTPSEDQRKKAMKALHAAVSKLTGALSQLKLRAEVVPVGSITRNTWLPGKADLDIFLLFERSFPEEELGTTVVDVAKRAFGTYMLRYSAHPYARVTEKGYEIDVVPAYEAKSSSELRTPVDRSPLHAEFLEKRMNPELAKETRLLKAFTRGIGAYGAEVKVNGFSGYLCELLLLFYGTFKSTLEQGTNWKEPTLVDMTGRISSLEEATRLFAGPLIVIDPVDIRRNVASALSRTQFHRFKAAAKAFLTAPSESFFFPTEREEPASEAIKEALGSRGTYAAVLMFLGVREAPDTLWTQAKSGARKVNRMLREAGFDALFTDGRTDERSAIAIFVELANQRLPSIKLRAGPNVNGPGDREFIAKHLKGRDTVAGPFILGDKWAIVKRRETKDAREFLASLLQREKAIEYGLPKKILDAPEKRLVDGPEIADLPEWVRQLILDWFRKGDFFAEYLVE